MLHVLEKHICGVQLVFESHLAYFQPWASVEVNFQLHAKFAVWIIRCIDLVSCDYPKIQQWTRLLFASAP